MVATDVTYIVVDLGKDNRYKIMSLNAPLVPEYAQQLIERMRKVDSILFVPKIDWGERVSNSFTDCYIRNSGKGNNITCVCLGNIYSV